MMAQLCAQTFADCSRSSRSRRSGKDFRALELERMGRGQPFPPFQWRGQSKYLGSELAPQVQPI